MSLYFILIDELTFTERLVPPLAAALRQRSFGPCRALCESLLPNVEACRENFVAGPEKPLLVQVTRGLRFDRAIWRALVGEVLLFAAAEVPELETAPETLCCLLAPGHYREKETDRDRYAPIQQAHFGTSDLTFGPAVYRPDHVGLNDLADTQRLADYLAGIDPDRWSIADLAGLPDMDDEERAEELEYVREWFPALAAMYHRASEQRQVIVCEVF
jgi:hypothetical protein